MKKQYCLGIIILVIIILAFLFSGVLKTPDNKNGPEVSKILETKIRFCPDEIILEIPDRIVLYDGYYGKPITNYQEMGVNSFIAIKWGDSKDWEWNSCNSGNEEGENINYLYCKHIRYFKTSINSDGIIGKRILKENIKFVIDPKDKTNEGYKIIEATC